MRRMPMNCSQTICTPREGLRSDRLIPNAPGYRGAAAMAYLKALATPEPSAASEPVPGLPTGRVFGAVKASLWALVAVGLGIILAVVCS
jgi:hypothetical protein